MKRQIFRNKLENPPVHVYNLTGISRGGGRGEAFLPSCLCFHANEHATSGYVSTSSVQDWVQLNFITKVPFISPKY